MSILIRAEQPAEIAAIRRLHEAVFPTPAEGGLVDALRDAGRLIISLVACDGSEVVGHVAFSPVTTPSTREVTGSQLGLGLAPVAVTAAHRRRGIARRLIEAGLEQARIGGSPYVVVFGEPGYYGRFGFLAAGRFGLVDEYGGGDAFQVLELTTGGIPRGAGLVRYAPEFAGFG